ncbi:Palmitoyltransferase [Pseudogymnoascus destructans]|nr:Palmitoyltransferase [Pseudogymnoascus destructans]OAF58286.1 Palmitoyltransferase [Pseudogymnoascus destructans]
MALLSITVPTLKKLAVPFVCCLIAFLSLSSQYLFYHLEPGPLTPTEAAWFNTLVFCIWYTYERACRVDPGRLPKSLAEGGAQDGAETAKDADALANVQHAGKWCKKCDALKPPRAHHCRQCNRCIPKMDHHCPWISNCVSHTTFPHFIRFVFYAVVSMGVLEYHLFNRGYIVYQNRNLPSYLGPSPYALAHLVILFATNSLALFILLILLVSAGNSLAMNTTMIESWVIERHESLANKARYHGGFVHGPGGRRIRIRKQEFPYDIGIWQNLVQGMGTPNALTWLLPFAGDPGNETGWEFPVNGFEDPDVTWPPPDPDRMAQEPWTRGEGDRKEVFLHGDGGDEVQEFRRRQQLDYEKRGLVGRGLYGRNRQVGAPGSYDWLELDSERDSSEYEGQDEDAGGSDGWFNSDGDRLGDYGVDEEAELVDWEEDDDIPLGELLRRRRGTRVAES